MSDRFRVVLLVVVVSTTVSITAGACTGDPAPPASGDSDGTSIVLAVAEKPSSLNPLAGYADHGAAKIFDGLVEYEANLSLRPVLAAALPTPSTDGRSWTVSLRPGVTFSDGTPFEATDVVDTYRALLDPAQEWSMRQRFSMLAGVSALDPSTVRFDLTEPYAPFPKLLTLGILPTETATSPQVRDPRVGTGPYKIADWKPGERLVMTVNKSYFDGPPAVRKVTVEFEPNEQTRYELMRDGKIDGTALSPSLAGEFADTDGMTVVEHSAADVRAVTLPAENPVASDPAIRLALNHAMDRELFRDVFDGKATVAHTPMPGVLAEFVEPEAAFEYSVPDALEVLENAGWKLNEGALVKDGEAAEFDVGYLKGDTTSEELAKVFATAAAAIGITVTPVESQPDGNAAVRPELRSFGDPFDPDFALYPVLHSGTALAGYSDESVDAALDTGRTATDPAQRAVAYRELQRDYLAAPGMVTLAEPSHTYVLRQSWDGYQPVVDGADVDVTWGPWWNLQKWTPR